MSSNPGQDMLSELKAHYAWHLVACGYFFQMGPVAVILQTPQNAPASYLDLVLIEVANKGFGAGSIALIQLIGLADKHRVTLCLYARAMDGKPKSTQRCIGWYARHGFKVENANPFTIENDDDLPDFDHLGRDMWRDPVENIRE